MSGPWVGGWVGGWVRIPVCFGVRACVRAECRMQRAGRAGRAGGRVLSCRHEYEYTAAGWHWPHAGARVCVASRRVASRRPRWRYLRLLHARSSSHCEIGYVDVCAYMHRATHTRACMHTRTARVLPVGELCVCVCARVCVCVCLHVYTCIDAAHSVKRAAAEAAGSCKIRA